MSRIHWIWFGELKISIRDKHALLDEFHDPEAIYTANLSVFKEHGIALWLAEKIISCAGLDNASYIQSRCTRLGIDVISVYDLRYPDRLRNIEYPPVVLYVKGAMPDFDRTAVVSIVGTRSASPRSLQIAYDLSYELAENEIMIVSGMAAGVDLAANRAGLDAAGFTVAVLGCGIDICYPSSSKPIYDRITEGGGCLISEYPPGTKPIAHNFPERNRIISGLSLGVLLVAAPEKSGALITANLAADQGRDVFVVPGGIDDKEFAGSNELIKQGADPVTGTYDIVMQYRQRYPSFFHGPEPVYVGRLKVFQGKNVDKQETASPKVSYRSIKNRIFSKGAEKSNGDALAKYENVLRSLSPLARQIVQCLFSEESVHIDKLVETTGVTASDVLTELTLLEIEGVVSALPGKYFKIN